MSSWQDRDAYSGLRRLMPADIQLLIATKCPLQADAAPACDTLIPAQQAEQIPQILYADPELRRDLNLWAAAQPSISAATRSNLKATQDLLTEVRPHSSARSSRSTHPNIVPRQGAYEQQQ